MVFFAGLPGVGKSLLLKECVGLARARGRRVHLLQWDVTRAAFETEELLRRYPETDGVTHPTIRRAVGLWARGAVLRWHRSAAAAAVLIGEVPLVGNRLSELVTSESDAAEALLAGEQTLFMLPVPSLKLRRHIEAQREQSIAQPQHERERADAPPNVLRALWHTVYQKGVDLKLVEPDPHPPYDPEVYAGVYERLLRHRHSVTLRLNEQLAPSGSVYAVGEVAELCATATEVAANLRRAEQLR